MFGLLVAIIYLSFVSLGLPDSLLGSAWPVMSGQFGVPDGFASIVSVIIGLGTVFSSLMSDRLTKRFGAGLVTAVSTAMTAAALFLFSISTRFWMLAIFAIPYGLGAGGVDAALNNYVALHFKSRHMSWLHCMWGVGASVSPFIMSYALSGGTGWNQGYFIVAIIQIVLSVCIFISLPLWKKFESSVYKTPSGEVCDEKQEKGKALPLKEVFKIRGAATCFLCFFCYCALEQTAMLWASSYMIAHNAFSEEVAAMFASLFFIGMTLGRGLNGFLTFKFSDRTLIRCGCTIITAGVVLIAIPTVDALTVAGFIILGLGCAPVYPSIIHSTPSLFGADKSQAVIGVQMAFAYIGGLASPLFGVLVNYGALTFMPLYLGVFLILMIVMHELTVKLTAAKPVGSL